MARRKRKTILGKKLGMSQLFDESGRWIPVTLIEAGPCTVLQIKSVEKDGYEALQVGFDETDKDPRKPRAGLFEQFADPDHRFPGQGFHVFTEINRKIIFPVGLVGRDRTSRYLLQNPVTNLIKSGPE